MSIVDRLPPSARDWLASQATGRALLGLAVLIGTLAILGLSELAGLTARLDTSVEALRREHQLQTALLADESWPERAVGAESSVQQVEDRFWRAATPGIAAAQLQGAVETAARAAGVTRPRIDVQPTPAQLGPRAVMFEISLSARDPQGQFLSLFQELARADGFLLPSGFEWNRQNGRLEVRLQAPALIEPAPAPPQGEGPR